MSPCDQDTVLRPLLPLPAAFRFFDAEGSLRPGDKSMLELIEWYKYLAYSEAVGDVGVRGT